MGNASKQSQFYHEQNFTPNVHLHEHGPLKLTPENTLKITILFRDKVTITGFSSQHLFGIVCHFRWNTDILFCFSGFPPYIYTQISSHSAINEHAL